jgi:glycosyltransferase involved in cell wall biosynthesis
MKRNDPARIRLLYLLPLYDANSPEHFYHLYGFLRRLRERIPLDILVEKFTPPAPADLPLRPVRIRLQAFRLVEEFFRFLAARIRGIKDFYVHYSYTGAVAASIVVRLLGGRAYYWNCGMYADMGPYPGEPWVRKLVFRWNCFCINTSARLCTFLVTGTPRMAAYYARHARIPIEKILVLPNFVDVDRFRAVSKREARRRLNLDPDRKVVMFLHRVSERRGAAFLPDLARSIRNAIGPFVLLVVGDGPYLPELRRRTAGPEFGSTFDFRKWVPNREVPLYFRAADLYIMPSNVEGFPRVLIEAMAAGCPFVSFDVGGVRDVLSPRQAESITAENDHSAFVRQSVRALKDGNLMDSWRKAGNRQILFFTEDRVLEAFVRMIDGRAVGWETFLSSVEIGT